VVTGADDRCVRVWSSSSSSSSSSRDRWQLLHTLRGHDGRVWAVDAIFAPSSLSAGATVLVASCGEDGRCCVWNGTGGQMLVDENIRGGGGGGDAWALGFDRGGARVVFACGDGTVR
jgi:WD40 repeat protein